MNPINLYAPKPTFIKAVALRALCLFWEKPTIELGMHQNDDDMIIAKVKYTNTLTGNQTSYDVLLSEVEGDMLTAGSYEQLKAKIKHLLGFASSRVTFKNLIADRINPQGKPVMKLNQGLTQ